MIDDEVAIEILNRELAFDPYSELMLTMKLAHELHAKKYEEARATYLFMKERWPKTEQVTALEGLFK